MPDSKQAVDSVLMTFISLQKLEHYCTRGKAFYLFSFYFSKRYVLIQGINASTLPIKSGVPPGGDGNRSGQPAPVGLTVGSRFFDRPVKKIKRSSFPFLQQKYTYTPTEIYITICVFEIVYKKRH